MANRPVTLTVPGKRNIPGWAKSDLVIEVTQENYVPYDKTIEQANPPATTTSGESITWFNNFGVRRSDRSENDNEDTVVPEYTVYLPDDLPSFQGKKRKLCVYYGGQVHVVEPKPAGQNAPGKFMFQLTAGDPPTGTIP